MSDQHRFASLSRQNIGYIVSSDSMLFWDQAYHSSTRVVATWAGEYDTCGDGLTQHSPAGVVREAAFADYLASLAQAVEAASPPFTR